MSDNTNAPSALPKNCAHCARIKSAEWHLVCDDCWPLIPEHIRNELIAAHAERVGSDRHLVAIEFALHSLAKAIPKSPIDPITGLVHVCTVRSDDGWEAMCCLWDGARWLYWDSELEPHGWEPVTDMNCVVEDWDLPVMPGSPCYRAPAPVAPDVPKDAEGRAISAFNLKAADLCMPFRIRDDDDKQAMRAALAAYAQVAPGDDQKPPILPCRICGGAGKYRAKFGGPREPVEYRKCPCQLGLSAPVAPGGVITEEQAERVARMFCNAAIGVRAWSKFSDNERRDAVMEMRAALSAALSPGGKVGGGE